MPPSLPAGRRASRRVPPRALLVLSAALLVALGACGDDDGGPEPLTAGQVNGSYSITLGAVSGGSCVTSPIYLTVVVMDGTGTSLSSWSNDPGTPEKWRATGTVALATGSADLRLWSEEGVSGWRLTGTFGRDGSFEGTLVDPIPGFAPYFTAGCSYTAQGNRTIL